MKAQKSIDRSRPSISITSETIQGLAYIRDYYRVPAYLGSRVNIKGRLGTITGVSGPYLQIVLDDSDQSRAYHPTWDIEYLES